MELQMYVSDKPTEKQMEWADLELGVLIHCLIGQSFDPEARKKFNPEHLDTDQWIRSAVKLGAKYAVLVCKHGTGFTNYPTKANDYSVASWAWKDGKGDIVADFLASCKKYGVKPGLYYHLNYNDYYEMRHPDAEMRKTEAYRKYRAVVEMQVEELWSRYGEVFELWFDSGIIPTEENGPDVYPLLYKYQNDAIMFNGNDHLKNSIRWVGNEFGYAPENCWSTVSFPDRLENLPPEEFHRLVAGTPDGAYWHPAETDVPNRDRRAVGGGWNWAPGEKPYCFTPETLRDFYFRSVGRNTNLLIGMAIAEDGSFEDEDQFEEAGRLIADSFTKPLGKTEIFENGKAEIVLSKPEKVKTISIREDQTNGHGILAWRLLLDGQEVSNGECIGHRRLVSFEESITASRITLEVTKQNKTVLLRDMEIFG